MKRTLDLLLIFGLLATALINCPAAGEGGSDAKALAKQCVDFSLKVKTGQ